MTINKFGIDESFISCDCGVEILRVTYDPIIDPDDGHLIGGDHMKDLDVAIFSLPGAKWTYWNRLRCIWHIIRNGTSFNDQIMLDHEQTKKLVEVLNDFLKYNPEDK